MWTQGLLRTLGMLGCAVQYGCLAHCTLEYVGELVVCSGPSMQPSLYTNNVVLAEHFSRHLRRIERGDVVIARNPLNPNTFICKRVVALQGDALNYPLHLRGSNRYVPLGHVWLEGDNPGNSTDSRAYGPVPYALIRSRVCLKVWPPSQFGRIPASPKQDSL